MLSFTSTELGQVVLPLPNPLPEAVEAGLFGNDEFDNGSPDEDEVQSLTEEHARELLCVLHHLAYLSECASKGISPRNRRPFSSQKQYESAYRAMNAEAYRLAEHYQALLKAYANGFGYDAAEALSQSLIPLIAGRIELPLPKQIAPRKLL